MVSSLPRPSFIERSPTTIEAEQIALWEAIADKTLYPGQPERLLINLLTYREALVRIGIQYAAEQNLVNYAVGVNLDQLGALLDVVRLPASKARCTMQFVRAIALPTSLLIPAGTRVAVPGDAGIIFATIENATIPANQNGVSVIAEATESGIAGNGFATGQINELLDAFSGVSMTASNTSTSADGADIESDDRFRDRIKLAPNKFSVAGSVGAYRYHTLTADQTINDAAIVSPFPTRVEVYPLTSGIPSAGILAKVTAALSNEKVRPLTDEVAVLPPTQLSYSINASVVALASADTATLSSQLQTAAATFASDRRSGLGRDVVRSQLIAALSLPGVYSVTLASPASDLIAQPSQWANCTAISVSITGTNGG
ncbi:MAG: baseplate J/gp47 family protein [Oculatellaceae cyanobacterium bins.114]|nr:baseplate J/gp47 family protein [Oculatellaceae cyanobacterium bins.114]